MDLKKLMDTPPWELDDDATEKVLAVLKDKHADESDRRMAVSLAGEITVVDDDVAYALLALARDNDESDSLRAAAVIALGPLLEYVVEMDLIEEEDDTISRETFNALRRSLRKLYMDADLPVEVGRRTLEASVRAPMDWHKEAVRAAFASDDKSWKLTAIFCARWVDGFTDEIMEALESENSDIHYEAVSAAGAWGVDAAWPYIERLVGDRDADPEILLAAIEAVVNIRPGEAHILLPLVESEDEDVVEAALEAIAMADAIEDHDIDGEDFRP